MADIFDEVEAESGGGDIFDEVAAENTYQGPKSLLKLGGELPTTPEREAGNVETAKSIVPRFLAQMALTLGGALQSVGEVPRGYNDPLTGEFKPTPAGSIESKAFNLVGKTGRNIAERASERLMLDTPENMGFWQENISNGVVSLLSQAPWIATGNAPVALTGMAAQVAAGEYAQARQRGVSEDDARSYATRQGLIEAATEMLPTKFLTAKGKSYAKRLLLDIVSDVPGEITSDMLGAINGVLSENPDATAEQIRAALPDAERMAGTAVSTITAGGGLAAVGRAVDATMPRPTEAIPQTIGETKAAVVDTAKSAAQKAKRTAEVTRSPVKETRQVLDRKQQESAEQSVMKAPEGEDGPIANEVEQNLKRTEQVKEKIGGGWNVGLGQATGSPGLLQLQREMQDDSKLAKRLQHEQAIINLQAEQDALDRTFQGDKREALAELTKRREEVAQSLSDAESELQKEADYLDGIGKTDAGDVVRTRLKELREEGRKEATRLYDKAQIDLTDDEADFVDEVLGKREGTFSEAWTNPSNNPLGIIRRARRGLESDSEQQFAVGDNVRSVVNGQEIRGPVTKVEMRGDGGNKVPFYTVKTDKGEFTVRWDKAHDIPKVRAETPVPVSMKRTELKDGMRVVDPEMGPGTISVNPTTLYRTFKADAGGQYSFPLGSGASNGTNLYAEGAPAPKPSSIHPNTAKVGARIVHPENGPGTIEVVHPESGSVQVRYDSDGELVNLTRNDQERTKYEQAPKADESEAEIAPEKPKRGKPVTLENLKQLRTQVVSRMREATYQGNAELSRNLGLILNDIETIYAKIGERPEGGTAIADLRVANAYYKNEFVPRFREGASEDVLRRYGDRYTVAPEMVGAKYFKPKEAGAQAARDFQKSFGNDPIARQALEAHIAQDLLRAADPNNTGRIDGRRAVLWMGRHREALTGLGLEGKFGSLKRAIERLEVAQEHRDQFEKSAAAKMLNVDPGNAVAAAFSGKGRADSQNTMRELISKMNGSQPAIEGLKRAFGEYVWAQTRLSGENTSSGDRDTSVRMMQKTMETFEGAMEILYSPEELEMMRALQDAASIKERINKPGSGIAGSQTAERLKSKMAERGIDVAFSSPKLWPLKMIAKHMVGDWRTGVNDYISRAMFDPRMALRLKLAMQIRRESGADAATKFMQREIYDAIVDDGYGFVAPDTAAMLRADEQAKSLKMNWEQRQALEKAMMPKTDEATGLWRAEDRLPTLKRAIRHVEQTDDTGAYVEFDIRNVGGVNAKFGHSGANEKYYRPIVKIVKEELNKVGGKMVMSRHGGDEFNAIMVGAERQQIDLALRAARARIDTEVVKPLGIENLKHAKDGGIDGAGIHYGVADITPGQRFEDILSEADSLVEKRKKGGKYE